MTQQDIDWLRFKLDALTPAVFESSPPAQALHGDASMSNLLRTDSGLVWNDLEPFLEAHALYEVVWQAFEGRRRPQAIERAAARLAHWRDGRVG